MYERQTSLSLRRAHWMISLLSYPSTKTWHHRSSLAPPTRFKSHLYGCFLFVKTSGCATSSYKCFICFQLAVNTLQTTTTGLIDLNVGSGWGGGALCRWPHSEPGASERLLSARSVLINFPSSRVMINANPIGCASDEKPVSHNEVRLRFTC